MSVLIINPLRNTLAHYERELIETLDGTGYEAEAIDTVVGDGIARRLQRIRVAARTIQERQRLAHTLTGQTVIVIWPLFGYYDPITLARLARRNRVFLIVHDPLPLRRSYGQSGVARQSFQTVVGRLGIQVIYHTKNAQHEGIRSTGIAGEIVPHPIRMLQLPTKDVPRHQQAKPVIRVLGQYKDTRSTDALAAIYDAARGRYELQIFGRGWPNVRGWTVSNQFIPEAEFSALIESSDCVVIPYDTFFQSGVAVRCLETGIPVVAPDHEHIKELYGDDWPGIVRHAMDWHDALVRALTTERQVVRQRHSLSSRRARQKWITALSGN